MVLSGAAERIEWGAAFRPFTGQAVSGDRHVVASDGARTLAAVIDGLGHGQEAAAAAAAAAGALAAGVGSDLPSLFAAVHGALRGTRGVTLTVAQIDVDAGTLSWAGVGDVEGVLLRAGPDGSPAWEHLVCRNGVLGWRLPALRVTTLSLRTDDTLLLATDGLRPGFEAEHRFADSPQANAARMVARSGRETDDALVLVVRYLEAYQ